jgi:hypothetical protein
VPTGKRHEDINPEIALPERLKGYVFDDIKPFIDPLRLDNADLGLKRFNNNKNIGWAFANPASTSSFCSSY